MDSAATTPGSLAALYRPRRFADVIGQQAPIAALRAGIEHGRLSHQLLFVGTSGLGKTTLARITAAALLCETPLDQREDADACGVCPSCIDITTPSHTHPDVIELDAASHGGKDEVKELAEKSAFAPMRASAKVYIIDEAQGLSSAGAQALLRLVEEPPPHVYFMLATTDPHKMLPTIRGRCATYTLTRPTAPEMAANLERVAAAEGWDLPAASASLLVDLSEPALGVRGTLMNLEKVAAALTEGAPLDPARLVSLVGTTPVQLVGDLWAAIVSGDTTEAFRLLDQARETVSEDVLRSVLVDTARTDLHEALSVDAESGIEAPAWRFSVLVEAAPVPAETELAVLRLTRPQLHPDPAALAALLERAEQVLADLNAALVGSPARSTEPVWVAAPPPEPAPPTHASASGVSPDPDPRLAAALEAARPASQAAPSSGHALPSTPADRPEPPEAPVGASVPPQEPSPGGDPAVVLLAAAKELSRPLAALLAACQLTGAGTSVQIAGPAPLLERLATSEAAALAAAASAGGLSVAIAR